MGSKSQAGLPTQALMERMGLPPGVFPSFLNHREMQNFQLSHELALCIDAGEYGKVDDLIAKLEKEPKLESIYKQQILYVQTLMSWQKGASPEEVLRSMKEVVKLSMRDFDPSRILRHVFTKAELNILNSLAISYIDAGDNDTGIEILKAIKDYIERKIVDRRGICLLYVRVLYNLSKNMGLRGHYDESISLSDTAARFNLEYGQNANLAGLYYNKGYALFMLGRKDEAQECIQNAYYIYRALKNFNNCELIKEYAEKNGITL